MRANVTGLDRDVRLIAGAVLGWLYLSGHVAGMAVVPVLAVALVLLLTGIVGWCPLYALFHVGTHGPQAR